MDMEGVKMTKAPRTTNEEVLIQMECQFNGNNKLALICGDEFETSTINRPPARHGSILSQASAHNARKSLTPKQIAIGCKFQTK